MTNRQTTATTRRSSPSTVAAGYVASAVEAMCALGADRRALLSAAGIATSTLEQPHKRLTVLQHQRLWDAAGAQLGAVGLGVRVGQHLALGRYGLLELLMHSAETVGEAIHAALRYWPLVTDDDKTLHARPTPQGTWVEFVSEQCGVIEAYAADMVYSLRILRALIHPAFIPFGVRFAFVRPLDSEAYRDALGVDPSFGHLNNAIGIPQDDWQRALHGRNQAVASLLDAQASEAMAQLRSGLAGRVLTHLRTQQPIRADLGSVAKALGVSGRTLQRRLHDEGHRFRTLVDAARREATLHYLTHTSLELAEISARIGFTDPSAFHQAVRRWFDRTATQVRGAATWSNHTRT